MAATRNDFYAVIHLDEADVIRVYEMLIDIQAIYTRKGFLALASRARTIRETFDRDMQRIAVDISIQSEKDVRKIIRSTRVRPSSGRPGKHLEDVIESIAIPTNPSAGAVGIGLFKTLDSLRNPLDRSRQPFWRAQEYGLDAGFVGRAIRGFFFGSYGEARSRTGGVPADPDYAGGGGPHPIFRASRGPAMIVQSPIHARYFLRDGSQIAHMEWIKRKQRAEQKMARSVALL